jgi:hypothetical protein
MAQAAVITVSYVNIQTSDNVNFNALGNVANHGTNTGALATLPAGKFFRFGIAINISGNPTPIDAFNAWQGTPTPLPANLGASLMAMQVLSTQTGNNVLAIQGAPKDGRNASKVAFVGGTGVWTSVTDAGDVLGNANPGTNNALGGTQVGTQFQISSGNASGTSTNVGLLASPGATWFNGLMYQVQNTNPATLTPLIFAAGVNFWQLSDPGDPGDPADSGDDIPPSFNSVPFSASFGGEADSIVNAPAILINVPEPATAGLLALGLLGLVARRRS